MTLCVVDLLEELDLHCQIKWPNDIFLNGKKIGGVLCETIDLKQEFGIALGVGINVNMPQNLLDKIDQRATSTFIETQQLEDISYLQSRLDILFSTLYDRYILNGFKEFAEKFCSHLIFKKNTLSFYHNGKKITGTFHSLHESGLLNILAEDNKIYTVYNVF